MGMQKYLDPCNYLRRLVRLQNRYLLGYLEALLSPAPEKPLRYPPIFFLGAPRSGSTLAVQAITDALDVGYISNCHCQWFGAPILAEKLFHPTCKRPNSDYQSRQGVIDGRHAPAECGEWWYRFFRRKLPYVQLDEVDPGKMRAFRRSVASLTNAFDRPVVFKNLYASLRIQPIAHYLPESLFIVMHRDEADNGHSLLEARYKRFNDYHPWFSLEPPEVERLKKLPPHEQVIEQIRHTHCTINADIQASNISLSRCFDLVYEELCVNPVAVVDAFHQFLAQNGCDVKQRGISLPPSFSRNETVRIDSQLYEALCNYATRKSTET